MQKKQNKNQLKSEKTNSKKSLKTSIEKKQSSVLKTKYKKGLLNKPFVQTKAEQKNWKEQYEDLNKKYQFLMAEYANYKKNNMKYIENLKKYEGQQLIKRLINEVIDDFNRAIEQEINTQNIDELKKGIQMIYEHFINILKSRGVKKISSQGQLFDPSIHCAVDSLPNEETPPDHIIHVIKEAYFFHDKVIRPAEVIVAKKPSVKTLEKKDSD